MTSLGGKASLEENRKHFHTCYSNHLQQFNQSNSSDYEDYREMSFYMMITLQISSRVFAVFISE